MSERKSTRLFAEKHKPSDLLAELNLYRQNLGQLARIGQALSSIDNFDELLRVILFECRKLLKADSGSIYLRLDRKDFRDAPQAAAGSGACQDDKVLLFKEAQNDSVSFNFSEIVMPVSEASIAGYVAIHGEVLNIRDLYELPEGEPFEFNSSVDKSSGYCSRSMLTIPMRAHDGEVLGVISLLNRKRSFAQKLDLQADMSDQVEVFSSASEELGKAVASQAGVAIENNKLIGDIKKLFNGFIITSIKAIEARDPSTAGHSSRVARLTVALAKAVSQSEKAPFSDIHYAEQDIDIFRKAGLLHDFGKIGIREHVLCKAEKLLPTQAIDIRNRFQLIEKLFRIQAQQQQLDLLRESPSADVEVKCQAIGQDLEARTEVLRADMEFVLEKSKPTFLNDEDRERLVRVAAKKYFNEDGQALCYLRDEELENLLIQKGSLNAQERQEIESHSKKSYDMLKKIPWTAEYDGMMENILYHHERENGSGYPEGLKKGAIPMGAQIIHIVDIFDALVASDRPYKPAMPLEKALGILMFEVKDQHLNKDLVDLFVDEKVYTVIQSKIVDGQDAESQDGYV